MNQALSNGQPVRALWYCARTQPKHEHIAAGSISKRLGLEVFNPCLRLERATRRGVVHVVEPVFPCYVFLRCVLPEYVEQIRYVTGVSSLVHFGERIPAVPDLVIDELRQCFTAGEPMTAQDQLQAGAEVTVAEGVFLGSRGIVVKVFPAKRRVQILLDFLGRTTLAEVDRRALTVEDQSPANLMPALASVVRPATAIAA